MVWVIRSALALLVMLVLSVLHYNLPQHDVVRIVGTYQERQDLSDWTRFFWSDPDDQAATLVNRDVQFIQAVTPDGAARVYRNEDTGWGWPPYFKFDTANLQTRAEDLKSTVGAPKWVVVTHYGWRNQFLSIFPNAIGVREVADPEATIIPWVSITILIVLALLVLLVWRMLAQFRERMIDPMVDSVGDTIDELDARADAARDRAAGKWARFTAWLGTWKSKPRR